MRELLDAFEPQPPLHAEGAREQLLERDVLEHHPDDLGKLSSDVLTGIPLPLELGLVIDLQQAVDDASPHCVVLAAHDFIRLS